MIRVLFCCVTALFAVVAPSQVERVPFGSDVPDERRIRCSLETYPAFGRLGATGWAVLRVTNPDSEPHRIEARLQTADFTEADLSLLRTVDLEPGATREMVYPLYHVRDQQELVVSADNYDEFYLPVGTRERGNALTILVLGDAFEDLDSQLKRSTSRRQGSREQAYVVRVEPDRLPDRWMWISGFDAVVVDAAADGVDTERLEVLRQYVRVGGLLVVHNDDALPEGPLAEACRRHERDVVGEGLGAVVAFPSKSERRLTAWLMNRARWSRSGTDGRVSGFQGGLGNPMLAGAFDPLRIPGLDNVPVRTFFGLIAVFVIVAGPINLFMLRRRRRMTRLVVTVPLLGFGFTLAILAYGFFGEGFGIRGAVRTTAVLDQTRREVSVVGTQTLYAGLSPSQLTPRDGSWVFSRSVLNQQRSTSHALEMDVQSGVLGGTLLPSRQKTTLVAASVGIERARIRFAAQAGGLTVIAGDELRPQPGATMVVRDPGGTWYLGSGDGTLAPADVDELKRVLLGYRVLLPEAYGGLPSTVVGQPPRSGDPFDRFEDEGFVGYVMFAEQGPGWDDLGLEVDWDSSQHFVIGLCSEEDFDV